MKFRKKPTVVEAHRWMRNDGDALGALGNDHMALWLGSAFQRVDSNGTLVFTSRDGRVLQARLGDWIARQMVKGEPDYWPIDDETFRDTYVPE